ncbi:MAG: hypothetical protein ABI679_15940 [Gemmatimonadota bacterium]
MTTSFCRALAISLGILPMGRVVLGQTPGSRALANPIAESADAFTSITAIRELSNGRVIVTDILDKSVKLVDLAAGTATQIGREGQGPGEYGFPGELLALPGDTTLLVDRVNRRFLVILPSGKTGESIPFPSELGSGLSDPRGIDRNGRIYFQGSLFGGNRISPGEATPDSLPILRWDRKRNVIDTVTHIKVPSISMNVSGGSSARTVMMRAQPYSPQDEWALSPDGRLGVARVADYHIDWISPTKHKTSGPVNRFERLRVTEGDKEALRKQNARSPRLMIGDGGGTRSSSSAPPPPTGAMPEPEYPEFKPPFASRAAFATPDGMLWVLRSRPADDPTPSLDVFDQRGVLVGKVTLPKDRRVVGFGNGTVYLARTDSDDLLWLEKYRR